MPTPISTPQSRPLPRADNLADACSQVIAQSQGDPATRFEQAIRGRDGQALVVVISRMINNHDAIEYREKEVKRFPGLLTVEDYVCRYGEEWGFDQTTIDNAGANARYFDQLVANSYGLANFRRYT